MKSKLLPDIFALTLLVVVVLSFLWRGASMQGVFFGGDEIGSDILNYSYPYREYLAENLKSGKVPLWNSWLGSGTPFLAQAQTGVFNPLAIALFLILPTPFAFNWFIIACFLLIIIGTYLYGRQIGFTTEAAFFAAFVFTLSGFMIGHLRHVPILATVAYMPFQLLIVEKMITNFRIRYVAALTILISLSIFGGHITTAYMMGLILCFYLILRQANFKVILLFALSCILAILLSSVQLVPAFELVPYSIRILGGFDRALDIAYALNYLFLFISPYAFGDPSRGTWPLGPYSPFWENIGYFGILPLVISILVVVFTFRSNKTNLRVWSVILCLSVVLVLGQNTFVYKFFWDFVPGFQLTRISGRWLLGVDLAGAILSGWGLMYLQKKIKSRVGQAITFCIIGLTLLDLFLFGYGFNTVMPLKYLKEPETVRFIKKDTDFFRIRSLDQAIWWQKAWEESSGWRGDLSWYLAQREILPLDFILLYRLSSPAVIYGRAGYFGVERTSGLDDLVMSRETIGATPRLASLLGMENVKYLISEASFTLDPGLELIKQIPTSKPDFIAYIYKNKKWLPRAYLVAKATYLPDSKDLLERLLSDEFDPSKEVLLEENPQRKSDGGEGKAVIRKYGDEKVMIDIDAVSGGFLVLSDTYYPGWNAYIDGKKTKIYRANYAYRAVYVDKGIHNVLFEYKPQSVELGKKLSLLGLLVLIAGVFMYIFRKRIFLLNKL